MTNNVPTAETITPEKAKLWLQKNVHNRPLRQSVVERYAEAIKNNQWELNGETIKFREDGVLLDGQHRLQAVVNAGKSIKSYVVRGLPAEVFDTIDVGANRAARDVLAVNGQANTSTLAVAARILYVHYELNEGYRGLRNKLTRLVTNRDILETVERYPELTESVSAVVGRSIRPYLSPAVAAYLHYLFSQIDRKDCHEFFEKLTKGDDLKENHPVLHLRNVLVGLKGDTKEGQEKRVALTIKAWNYFRKRRTIKRLELRAEERTVNFPVPE